VQAAVHSARGLQLQAHGLQTVAQQLQLTREVLMLAPINFYIQTLLSQQMYLVE
jgi:hypothetical protein